jgi:glycerophosphoryl diester phosphodiesterase
MRKVLLLSLAILIPLAGFMYFNNRSRTPAPRGGSPVLLAHRGLAQTYTRENLDSETCTATRIYPPEHPYLENTLPSMEAAFAAGAEVVEFDVHPTTDGKFAVFHDWTLDCRTEGKGVTRERTLAELKALDIGYGYTADGGKTFPFRGKGVGLMPSLDEVLATFPGRRFLINIKSDDPNEGEKLALRLAQLKPEERARLMAYGATYPINVLHERLPDLVVGSRASLTSCLVNYAMVGWAGIVPDACRMGIMFVPLNVAPWIWGWPDRFMERMRGAGVNVFVLGPYDGGLGTSGVDTAEQLAQVPAGFTGGIWTNRIDRIGSAVRASAQ